MTFDNSEPKRIKVSVEDDKTNFLSSLIDDNKLLEQENRRRRNVNDQKSILSADVPAEEAKGWIVQRIWKKSTRVKRQKSHDRQLEDRVWCLLYSMGYQVLNSKNFEISFKHDDGSFGKKQVDVYVEDGETAIVVECKSREEREDCSLKKDIQETISLQLYFRTEINKRHEGKPQLKIIWIYATNNIIWEKSDVERAEDGGIYIITENELQYFETFVRHMGPAGKYQILGEFLKGQKVPGLADIKLPAIKGKIGGETYYSFVTTPRNLLKIAFINHQALNHPGGRPAYQRMISASRIKSIGAFIKGGGYFPTNILVNLSDTPRFDLISNKDNTDPNIKFGWVTLPSKYHSAWIIDGQHRLYGFSHLDEKFLDQSLFVVAFEKMEVKKEADLFITINHKQKSVPKNLLLSLFPIIRKGDSDPSTALTALGSEVVITLNTDKASPFARRFPAPDLPREPSQNLTLSEVVKGLRISGLIGTSTRKTRVPGSLSGATDDETITRAVNVLSAYFKAIREANPTRWEAGKDMFIAINPGIRAHLTVIAEVAKYLSNKKSLNLALMESDDFAQNIIHFCAPIFDFIKNASYEDIREKFSRKFGEGGVREYSYHLMHILTEEHTDFGPENFQRWARQIKSEKIDEVNQFLMKLAERLTDYVIDTLQNVHGKDRLTSGDHAFWEIGVESDRIRSNAYQAQQKDKTRRKPKEAYLNIVDLAEIVKQPNNWNHFKDVFNNQRPDERAGQKYYLDWINLFNQLRNIAAHKNQLKTYTDEDLEFVEWLRTEVSPKVPE